MAERISCPSKPVVPWPLHSIRPGTGGRQPIRPFRRRRARAMMRHYQCGGTVMPGNTFGELFRVTTGGVSHGPGYAAIIDGCPPGMPLSADDLRPDLRRRRPGQSKIVTQRQEDDEPEIWSGVF